MQPSRSNTAKELKKFFVPPALMISIYLLINLILLSILNLRGLWDVFINPAIGPINNQDISPLTDAFNSLQTKLDTPFVYLFWIFIGCIAYSVVLCLQNAVAVSKKETEKSRFSRTGEFRTTGYWQSTMTTNLLLFTSAISSVIYMILYFRNLLPAISRLFHQGLYNPSHYHGLVNALGAVLMSTLANYVFVLLYRVLRYHWHTIRPI